MVLPKNAEFRRLTLQKVIIFLVYFSSPAWQREEVPCSTRDLQAAFSPLLACYRRRLVLKIWKKRLPQLYYIKMKISFDLGFIAIGVAMAT